MVIKFCLLIIGFLVTSPLYSSAMTHNHYSYHMKLIETRHQIPSGLLTAIAKVESGRWNDKEKQLISWPWVIHANGKGHYFSTKEMAIQAVKDLQAQGVKNIDVGLMQINLLHHPDAFESLDKAFEPKHNIDYAARFLKTLKKNHQSWQKAVSYYHSASPTHHIPYYNKVLEIWQKEQKENLYQAFFQERFSPENFSDNDKKPRQKPRIITPPIDRLKVYQERMKFRLYQVRDRQFETKNLRRGKVYRLKPSR